MGNEMETKYKIRLISHLIFYILYRQTVYFFGGERLNYQRVIIRELIHNHLMTLIINKHLREMRKKKNMNIHMTY